MSIKITDGLGPTEHITSNDIVGKQVAFFGDESCVFQVGNVFAYTLVDNNTIEIADGEGVIKGCFWRILPGTVETVKLTTGTAGMYRYDLIVAQYAIGSDGVEAVTLEVLEGTPASTQADANLPEYTIGDIRQGDRISQYPLYKVLINGITVDSITPMMTIRVNLEGLEDTAVLSNHVRQIVQVEELPDDAGEHDDTWYVFTDDETTDPSSMRVTRQEFDTTVENLQQTDTALSENIETAKTELTESIDDVKTALEEQHAFVTQEEYDALPDTKLTDGVIYFISTGG